MAHGNTTTPPRSGGLEAAKGGPAPHALGPMAAMSAGRSSMAVSGALAEADHSR